MSNKGVCRTAPATSGLLNIQWLKAFIVSPLQRWKVWAHRGIGWNHLCFIQQWRKHWDWATNYILRRNDRQQKGASRSIKSSASPSCISGINPILWNMNVLSEGSKTNLDFNISPLFAQEYDIYVHQSSHFSL